MSWGVFYKGELVHIAPTNKDGTIEARHTLSADCFCIPDTEQVAGTTKVLIKHCIEN